MTEQALKNYMKNPISNTIGEMLMCEKTVLYSRFPVHVLGLSVRSSNCMQNANIQTVKQLLDTKFSELITIRSLGFTSVKEILQKCEKFIQSDAAVPDKSQPALDMMLDDIRDVYSQSDDVGKHDIMELVLSFFPEDYPHRQNVESILKDLEARFTKVVDRNISIPDFLNEKKALPFANAYCLATGFDFVKRNLLADDRLSLLSDKMDNHKCDISEISMWYDFAYWVTKDYRDEISKTLNFSLDYRNERVIQRLAEGATLEEVGNEFEISRQRVQQIKEKAFARIRPKASACEFFFWVYGYCGCPTIVKLSELDQLINSNEAALFRYEVKNTVFDSENKWRYSEKFDSIVFLFDGKDAEAEIVKKVRSLPDDIRKEQMDDYLLNVANECNCPIDVVVEEADSQYKQYGNVFSRRKYSLREMCSCILSEFFPDGYHISSETDYRLFCTQLTSAFGYDSSQLSMQYLANIILELGYLCDKGTYKHFDYLSIDPELIQRLENYIDIQFTKMGRTAMSYLEVYTKLSDDLRGSPINNQYILHGVLNTRHIKYYTAKDYILLNENISVDDDFVRYIKENYPISMRKVIDHFCISSEAQLVQIVGRCPNIKLKSKMLVYQR